MPDLPQYLGAFNNKSVTVSTGNTDRSGATGTKYAMLTGAGSGTVVHRVKVIAVGTTTVGAIRFFIQNSDGLFNVHEVEVTAKDLSGGSADDMPFSADVTDFAVSLKAGEVLYVATHKSETFHVTAFAQDY